MSYSRERKNYPGQRIEFTQDASLGKGMYGAVYVITEKKVGADDFLLPSQKPNGFARLVKCHDISPTSFQEKVVKLAYDVKVEYEHSMLTHHLHMKQPIKLSEYKYVLVMDKMPGESFHSICQKAKSGVIKLSASQYLSLLIDIVRKYQSQVEACGLVHRDIKPDNIMVDLSNPDYPNVNFIDYGLAKKASDVEYAFVGSRGYMAPEIEDGDDVHLHADCTVAGDVFSLGICFLQLLSNNFDLRVAYENKPCIGEIIHSRHNIKGSFHFKPELNFLSDKLRDVIKQMCQPMQKDRITLVDLENKLQEIRVFIDKLARTDNEIRMIEDAHRAAIDIRKELSNSDNIHQVKNAIDNAKFDDTPLAINEFIKTLGMRSLIGCKSKQDLFNRVQIITSDYEDNYRKINTMVRKLEAFKKFYATNKDYFANGLDVKVERCMKLADRKLAKYGRVNFRSLDDVDHAADRLGDAVRILDHAFKGMLSYFSGDKEYNESLLLIEKNAAALEIARDKASEEKNDELEMAKLEYTQKMKVLNKAMRDFENFQLKYQNTSLFRKERLGEVIAGCIGEIEQEIGKYSKRNIKSRREYEQVNCELNDKIKMIPNILGVMIANRCKHVYSKMTHYHFESSSKDLLDLMDGIVKNQPGGADELLQLKEVIRLAISGYVYKTATAKNMFFHERAASARRIADMRDVINVIGQENKTVDEIKQELEEKISHIKTGFFGRSKLRDVIRHAIEIHGSLKDDAGARLEV